MSELERPRFRTLQSYKEIASTSVEDHQSELKQYIHAHRFDPAKRPSDDDHILFLQGIPIGSKENIITITGKSKSRKTIAASAIATSIFTSGEPFLSFSSNLPETANVLHIDTEQGYKHYYHSVERIFRDADLQAPDRFTSIHTRDADIPLRLELIDYLCESLRPAVLIIDGLTDLVYDINDQAEATKIGEKFLQLSSKYQMLVIGVIHTTKTTGYMTGAIGTIFEKKSETVIKVELMEGNPMISDISCQFSRNKPFETFAIEADENNNYSIVEASRITKNGRKEYINLTPDEHRAFLDQLFGENITLSAEKLKKIMRSQSNRFINSQIPEKEAKSWIDQWVLQVHLNASPDGYVRAYSIPKPLHDNQLSLAKNDDEDLPF